MGEDSVVDSEGVGCQTAIASSGCGAKFCQPICGGSSAVGAVTA